MLDKKIRAEFFSRRFSLMQGTILRLIDEELDDDVFVKLITAYFHTVTAKPILVKSQRSIIKHYLFPLARLIDSSTVHRDIKKSVFRAKKIM